MDDGPPPGAEPPTRTPGQPRQHTLRRRHRLAHDREYDAVFKSRLRKARGPLIVFLRPSELPDHRLGLSIGRRVGGAVTRARLKRMIREAFRLSREDLPRPEPTDETSENPGEPRSYDIVVSARAHDPLPLARYRDLLAALVADAHRDAERRNRRRAARRPTPPPTPPPTDRDA